VVNGGGGAAPEGLDEDGQVAVALDALEGGLSCAEAEGSPAVRLGATAGP
jgi:hypothetical protein